MWGLGLCVLLGSGYFPTPATLWDWHSSDVLYMASTRVALWGLLYCTYRWRNKKRYDVGLGWWEIQGGELTHQGQTFDYCRGLCSLWATWQTSHWPSVQTKKLLGVFYLRGSILLTICIVNTFILEKRKLKRRRFLGHQSTIITQKYKTEARTQFDQSSLKKQGANSQNFTPMKP